jgi:hypothetical protein
VVSRNQIKFQKDDQNEADREPSGRIEDSNSKNVFDLSWPKRSVSLNKKKPIGWTLAWAKINRFYILRVESMIHCLNNPPSKFQPPIRVITARIKTRVEKCNGWDIPCIPSNPSCDLRSLIKINLNLSGRSLVPKIFDLREKGLNQLILAVPRLFAKKIFPPFFVFWKREFWREKNTLQKSEFTL